MTSFNDARQYAPATERNQEFILEVLQRVLPPTGNILEIASGTGQHAIFFSSRLQPRQWFPSDPNPMLRESIAAWQKHSPSDNLHPPLNIDAQESVWAVEKEGVEISAIVNINMIHISPWSTCLGLIEGAGRLLPQGGVLYLYGPYKLGGEHTAPSNLAFDESLSFQNPEWGVRNLEDVVGVAEKKGLKFLEKVQMPANNLSVVFYKD
ncbi:MAG: class I SAM-dependent methyltransferase [Trichodesmium sp. MAG_R04]|nr:class I SAM-dependent methyltransferase [Trichodesmium sp. MAG_R04]